MLLEALTADEPLFTEGSLATQNSRRVSAVSQDVWGGLLGVSWPSIIDLLIRQEHSDVLPGSVTKETFHTDFPSWFLSLDHGYSEYPQALMYVCSQGYCHLINRMRRDIKCYNMSF